MNQQTPPHRARSGSARAPFGLPAPLLPLLPLLPVLPVLLLLWLPAQPAHAAPTQSAPPPAPQQEPAPVLVPIVRNGTAFPARSVEAIPVDGPPTDRPAHANADMNLGLRSWTATAQPPLLIDIGGPTDDDAPQLSGLFHPPRVPPFAATFQVYDWNWGCGGDGCRGAPLANPPVTLLQAATGAHEFIFLPSRRAEILGDGFVAMVLYAAPSRLTIKYTREDSPVYGYTIHLEGLEVDPALVSRYEELNAAGRGRLPGLRNGEMLGLATGSLLVAVRDTGTFMDPRTRKDWWRGH